MPAMDYPIIVCGITKITNPDLSLKSAAISYTVGWNGGYQKFNL
jgi:hypothetical protein